MKEINLTIRINKMVLLVMLGLVLMLSTIFIVNAQRNENSLPVGTNTRAFVLNINGGIVDPANDNMSSESILVQFYDKSGLYGSELHSFDVLINLSKPNTIQSDIANGIANESRMLEYNLTEVFVPDYTRILIPGGTYP